MEQRRHGKFTTGHVISHGRRPMALGRLSAADSMARDPEAGISRLSVGDVVPRASLQAPRRRRRWSRRVLLAVLGGVALAGILGLGLGLGLSAPGRSDGGDGSGLLAPRPPPPPFSPLEAEVTREVVLDLSSGVLLSQQRVGTAQIIDEIVKGITDQGQPAPVSIAVLQRVEVIADQGDKDDTEFEGVLCDTLSTDYDRSRCSATKQASSRRLLEERAQRRSLALASWNMEVMLQPGSPHLVADGPDLDAVEGVSSATLQAVAIEMRTIVRPSAQDNLVEDAMASGDAKTSLATAVFASPLAIASSTRLSCDPGSTTVRISMATACSFADETPSRPFR